jgi:hypothetical protein
MEPIKIGERVGLVLKTNVRKHYCFFLGYGVYEGQFIPIDSIDKRVKRLNEEQKICCRFKLDSGEIIYDFQCWFMSEERFNEAFINDCYEEGWKIINVDNKGRRRHV